MQSWCARTWRAWRADGLSNCQVARKSEERARRQVHDLARRSVRRHRPTASPFWIAASASTSVARICRASRTRSSTRSTTRCALLPDGPERLQLFDEAKRLLIAYAPYKWGVHRIHTDIAQPWLHGYRRGAYWSDWWQYVDIDAEAQAKAIAVSRRRFSADERRALAPLAALPRAARSQTTGQKIFRYAFPAAETGFDPAQISDLYSRTSHFAHLRFAVLRTIILHARCRLKPLAAAALPEISSDFRVLHVSNPARHLLSGRSCVQRRQARARRAGFRVFAEAFLRSALEESDHARRSRNAKSSG